jgi:hypothetical protein
MTGTNYYGEEEKKYANISITLGDYSTGEQAPTMLHYSYLTLDERRYTRSIGEEINDGNVITMYRESQKTDAVEQRKKMYIDFYLGSMNDDKFIFAGKNNPTVVITASGDYADLGFAFDTEQGGVGITFPTVLNTGIYYFNVAYTNTAYSNFSTPMNFTIELKIEGLLSHNVNYNHTVKTSAGSSGSINIDSNLTFISGPNTGFSN